MDYFGRGKLTDRFNMQDVACHRFINLTENEV